MDLTAEQQRAVAHDGPSLAVVGAPGTGKTTVLLERYRRLVRSCPASRVLVVARNRAAADRFLVAVLPDLRGGFDALPITTVWGLAYDVAVRSGGGAAVELVAHEEQRRLVRRLVAEEDPSRWPRYGPLLRRPAFADEVLRRLHDDPPEPEIAEFTGRYRAALEQSGQVDAAGLVQWALAAAQAGRFDHILVDDADDLPPDGLRLVEAVAGEAAVALTSTAGIGAEVDVALTRPFRATPPGTLVCSGHPSAEAEAVAGELLAARRHGTPWSDMAVLVRDLGRRARSIGRALARHGIPVVPAPSRARGEPVVAAIVEELRSAPSGARPADVAYDVWASRFSDETDDRVLDAVVALMDGLESYTDRHPHATVADALSAIEDGELVPAPWRASASSPSEGVTITSVEAAAGREWRTVVIAGLVEGELPRARRDIGKERRLFGIATSRATDSLVAVAAPAPGVLLSRFVESWPQGEVKLPMAPGRPVPSRQPTGGAVPVSPGAQLQLSASQLDTYTDCPLRYAYHYVARAREESGIHAGLGTLVHEVLARFLDPEAGDPPPRTFEGLMEVANAVWTDDIGRYRPQIEEARRDFVSMLTGWWAEEGVHDPRPLAVERAFDVEVGPHRLRGQIDRVDRADDGAGVRVIDYKTGKREPRPSDVAGDLQLAVYHLAATRDPELAALGPPTQLQLRYLRSMHRLDQPVTEDHVERTEARVLAVAERILAEDFEPSVAANCRNCSYHRLCPLQPAGRRS